MEVCAIINTVKVSFLNIFNFFLHTFDGLRVDQSIMKILLNCSPVQNELQLNQQTVKMMLLH